MELENDVMWTSVRSTARAALPLKTTIQNKCRNEGKNIEEMVPYVIITKYYYTPSMSYC